MGCKGSSVRITPSRPKFPESRLFARATGFFHGHSLARLRMKITLQRPSGFLRNSVARALSLTVFLNGDPIGKLATGESKAFPLPDEGGVLQVGISWRDEGLEPINRDPDRRISGCSISSQGLALGPADMAPRCRQSRQLGPSSTRSCCISCPGYVTGSSGSGGSKADPSIPKGNIPLVQNREPPFCGPPTPSMAVTVNRIDYHQHIEAVRRVAHCRP